MASFLDGSCPTAYENQPEVPVSNGTLTVYGVVDAF
jgi:hypothetical protein